MSSNGDNKSTGNSKKMAINMAMAIVIVMGISQVRIGNGTCNYSFTVTTVMNDYP